MDFSYLESKLGKAEIEERSKLREKMIKIAHLFHKEASKHVNYTPNTSQYDKTIDYYQREIRENDQRTITSLAQLDEKHKADIQKLIADYQLKRKALEDKSSSYKEGLERLLQDKEKQKEDAKQKEPVKLFSIRQDFERVKRDWQAHYGELPVELPAPNSKATILEPVKVKAQPIPLINVKGLGAIPMTAIEAREESEMEKLRREARQEEAERKAQEEAFLREARERSEAERRAREEADRRRQDQRRQEEIQGKVFSLHSEMPANDDSESVTSSYTVTKEAKTKSGRRVIIKSPSNTPPPSVKEESYESDNSWTSEDQRNYDERMRLVRERNAERKRREAEAEREAYEIRRQQIESEGDEQVTFADFIHQGSFAPKPQSTPYAPLTPLRSVSKTLPLPPASRPVIGKPKRPVKTIAKGVNTYAVPSED